MLLWLKAAASFSHAASANKLLSESKCLLLCRVGYFHCGWCKMNALSGKCWKISLRGISNIMRKQLYSLLFHSRISKFPLLSSSSHHTHTICHLVVVWKTLVAVAAVFLQAVLWVVVVMGVKLPSFSHLFSLFWGFDFLLPPPFATNLKSGENANNTNDSCKAPITNSFHSFKQISRKKTFFQCFTTCLCGMKL